MIDILIYIFAVIGFITSIIGVIWFISSLFGGGSPRVGGSSGRMDWMEKYSNTRYEN